jgi:hypothetical protein
LLLEPSKEADEPFRLEVHLLWEQDGVRMRFDVVEEGSGWKSKVREREKGRPKRGRKRKQ